MSRKDERAAAEVLVQALKAGGGTARAAARELARATSERKDAQTRELVLKAGAVEPLCALLTQQGSTENDSAAALHAVTCLFHLARSRGARDEIREHGGIAPMVAMLPGPGEDDEESEEEDVSLEATKQGGSVSESESVALGVDLPLYARHLVAVKALINVCSGNDANRETVAATGGAQALATILERRPGNELVEHVTFAIANLAQGRADKAKRALWRSGCVTMLVDILRDGPENATRHALSALANLTSGTSPVGGVCRVEARAAASIAVPLLRQPSPTLEGAAALVGNLATGDTENKAALNAAGVFPALIAGMEIAPRIACAALTACCIGDVHAKDAVREAGGLEALTTVASSHPEAAEQAIWAIGAVVAGHEGNATAACSVGVVPVLVKALTASDGVARAACGALAAVSECPAAKDTVHDAGAIPELVNLATSKSEDDGSNTAGQSPAGQKALLALRTLCTNSDVNVRAVRATKNGEMVLDLLGVHEELSAENINGNVGDDTRDKRASAKLGVYARMRRVIFGKSKSVPAKAANRNVPPNSNDAAAESSEESGASASRSNSAAPETETPDMEEERLLKEVLERSKSEQHGPRQVSDEEAKVLENELREVLERSKSEQYGGLRHTMQLTEEEARVLEEEEKAMEEALRLSRADMPEEEAIAEAVRMSAFEAEMSEDQIEEAVLAVLNQAGNASTSEHTIEAPEVEQDQQPSQDKVEENSAESTSQPSPSVLNDVSNSNDAALATPTAHRPRKLPPLQVSPGNKLSQAASLSPSNAPTRLTTAAPTAPALASTPPAPPADESASLSGLDPGALIFGLAAMQPQVGSA